jgi:MATE family multidrug resistance protein
LAAPLIVAQLAQNSMSFIDTLMVGRLGQAELAGIALGSSIFFSVMIVASGVVLAVGPMVAQAYGAGDRQAIVQATRHGLLLGVGLALPAVTLYWNVKPLLLAVGQAEATAELASGYLRAISWGFLPAIWLVALRSFLEGIGRPQPILYITLFGVGLNVLANNALMFGRFGFPALGLIGTGYASAIVYSVMLLLTVGYVLWRLKPYRLLSGFTLNPPVLRELVTLGWPIGLTLGFETGLFTVTALLMGLVGESQLAAHQIALQSASFTFMVPLGLAIATSVRVGHAVGRRDLFGAARAGYAGMGLSALFMAFTAMIFWLLPQVVIALYLDVRNPANAEVVAFAVTFLGIAAAFQVVDGLQVSATGALRGLKDTRVPMFISLIAYWLVGMSTGAILAFGLGLEGRGLWWGLVLGLATAAVLLVTRFTRLVQRATPPVAQVRPIGDALP